MNFKQLVLMNLQALTNFPYIEKDFDAVTDYELLCLVVDHLNEVIKNSNEQNTVIQNLYNAFVTLKDYVDNYFDNLDIQTEIDNKLEEMTASGELAKIINQEIFTDLNNKINQNTTNITELENEVESNRELTYQQPYYNVLENGGSDDGENPVDSIITTAKSNGYFKFYFPQNSNKNASYYFTNAPQFNNCEIITDDGVILSVPSAEMITYTSSAIFNSNIKFLLRSSNEVMLLPKNKPDLYNMLHMNYDYRLQNLRSNYQLDNNLLKMFHYKYGSDYLYEEVNKTTYYQQTGTLFSRIASTPNSYFNGLCLPITDEYNSIQTVTNGAGASPNFAILNDSTGVGIFADYSGSGINIYYNNASTTLIQGLNFSKAVISQNPTNSWNYPMIYKMRYNKKKNRIDFIINTWIVASYTLPFTPTYWGFGINKNNINHQIMRPTVYYQEQLPVNYNLRILIVGDSRFYGNGQTYKIDEVLKNGLLYNGVNDVKIDNLAVSGYNLSQINSLLMDTDLTKYDIVIYEGGINNYNTGIDTIANTLGSITNYLNSSGCLVIYTTCIPCGYGGTDPVANQRALAYYGIVNAMYVGNGSYPNDKNIIIDNNMGNEKYNSNIPVCSDGVHPNDNGIIEISRNIISAIFNYFKTC